MSPVASDKTPPPRSQARRSMRGLLALKVLVIAMGVTILAGFAAIVAVLVDRATDGESASAGPREFALALPPGAVVEDSQLDGALALIRVALPDGAWMLYLVDMNSGATRGVARLTPGDPADGAIPSEAP